MTKPYIACCVIVRDAEKTIGDLLDSIDGAFDEYVFVDTGSVDKTRKILWDWTRKRSQLVEGKFWPEKNDYAMFESPPDRRYVLANFEWVDDFAAARNFSFGLAQAKWRGYFDADDIVSNAERIKPHIQGAEKRSNGQVNALSMPYVYVENDTEQDVVRFVRWEDGFRWEDEIHEHLVCRGNPRVISKVTDLKVLHQKTEDDHFKAYERNARIARRIYSNPETPPKKRARMAFHLAQEDKILGCLDDALEHLWETIEEWGETNLGSYAWGDIVRVYIAKGDLDEALNAAAVMSGRLPEHREGMFHLGVVHAMKKDWGRAVRIFDEAYARQGLPISSLDDIVFMKGIAPSYAALSYLECGRLDDAARIANEVPAGVRVKDAVRPIWNQTTQKVMEKRGLNAVRDIVNYLIWDTEAPKALEFLNRCVPAAVSNRPEISAAKRFVENKLPHLKGWEEYKEAYASIPSEAYHTDQHVKEHVLSYSRAEAIVNWAKSCDDEGEMLCVCSIGFQDGIIEEAVLEANDRISLTVCDVAPQSNEGLQRLQKKFPGRVESHAIVKDHYDWPTGSFDAIFMFEVLEHLPEDLRAMRELRNRLARNGRLFISTPIASRWVEPYLTEADKMPEWYGHVRAHNHVSMWRLIKDAGLDGTLVEGWDSTFIADLHQRGAIAKYPPDKSRVSIVVPATPNPFDAFSHLHRFVGGSEECVIHLSEALANMAFDVTVFCPTPEGEEIVRGHNGVLWRPIDEFDPLEDHGAVMFWRSASLIPREKVDYRKILWLHDAYYGVPSSEYERADDVIVLSNHHASTIRRYDGFEGKSVKLGNGIDSWAFPVLDEDKRDPHKMIYASSPDRGLARLLSMWPIIRKEVPDATLDIFYDWTDYHRMFPSEAAAMTELVEAMSDIGVTFYGGVPHAELHDAFRRAGVWAYPNSGEVETFCITAVKAQACGCWPVVTNAGALHEVVLNGDRLDVDGEAIDTYEGSKKFLDAVVDALRNGPDTSIRMHMRKAALQQFAWPVVADGFAKVIVGKVTAW